MHLQPLLWALLLFAAAPKPWVSSFPVDRKNLGPSGSNPYFVLQPGYRLHFARGTRTVTMTVLAETKTVDGVETRVVEDREEEGGKPIEITRDYYAIDRTTGDVYYFGEDVDVYKAGKVAGHEGAWLSGVAGAKFGMMMPARPAPGDRFYQEQSPGKAMDRAEVVAIAETVVTPAGKFEKCVHMRETSLLEKGALDDKWYAPGVGLVKDGEVSLVKIDKP